MPSITNPNYLQFTEVAGEEISQEQVDRMVNRYAWAGAYCKGRDVLEVACGTGQGLGYLAKLSRSLQAGDVSPELVGLANNIYKTTIPIVEMDAHRLPFEGHTLDLIILFEALYYLSSPEVFVQECARVLRPGGMVLIATANKDLYDFNPSPHSNQYFGGIDLPTLFSPFGFSVRIFGDTPLERVSLRQKLLRPIKRLAVRFNLIPTTMVGKRLLKRLVFGRMVPMPGQLEIPESFDYLPIELPVGQADYKHKVLLCEATLSRQETVDGEVP